MVIIKQLKNGMSFRTCICEVWVITFRQAQLLQIHSVGVRCLLQTVLLNETCRLKMFQ